MSQVEVDKVIPQSGTTLTIGDSGDTVTIPSGATLAIAGSVTGFTSAGIDDNATSVAITINSSEQVGIGTTSPDHLLHISASSSNAQLKLQRTGSATATYNISASSDGLAFSNQVTGSEVMRITSTGLGIGTSSPDTTLSLEKNNAPVIQFKDTSGATDEKIWRVNGLNDAYRIQTWNDALNSNQVAYQVMRSGVDVSNHRFYTEDSERMRLTSTGLGIGTSSPASLLHVSSNGPVIKLTDTDTGATHNLSGSSSVRNFDLEVDAGSTSGSPRFALKIHDGLYYTQTKTEAVFNEESNDVDFRVESNGDANMLFVDGGNDRVGIGTSSPGAKVHIYTGSSGGSINTSTDDLVIESNTTAGINILTNSAAGANGVIYFGDENDNNAGRIIYLHSDNAFSFGTNGAEKMRIDSSGNVGIGTTSPDYSLEVAGTALFGGSVMATGSTTTTASRRAIMTHDGSSMKLMASGDSVHRNMIFYRDGGDDEAMRIDTSNRLMIGTTNTTFNAQLTVNSGTSLRSQDGYNGNPPVRMFMGTDFTGGLFVEFTSSTGARLGSITRASSTSIAFNTTSDYRLKENVVDLDNATARLKQLQPKRFNFISDADTTVDGFLAHEVSNIVPEAVTGEKDEIRDFGNIVDENNNIIEENVNENYEKEDGHTWVKTGTKPVYQGIDQSKLVPLLVKTIQELEARITTLENA